MKVDGNIYKFQRPLFDSADEEGLTRVLAYNQDRSATAIEMMDDEDIEELFPNEAYRTYWKCTQDEDGYLVPLEQVEEQDW